MTETEVRFATVEMTTGYAIDLRIAVAAISLSVNLQPSPTNTRRVAEAAVGKGLSIFVNGRTCEIRLPLE